jgi:hypothetical protein
VSLSRQEEWNGVNNRYPEVGFFSSSLGSGRKRDDFLSVGDILARLPNNSTRMGIQTSYSQHILPHLFVRFKFVERIVLFMLLYAFVDMPSKEEHITHNSSLATDTRMTHEQLRRRTATRQSRV